MWGGRFAEAMDPRLDRLNRSLPVDRRLWREDLDTNRAWVHALEGVGVLTAAECREMLGGLDAVGALLEAGAAEGADDEDIHSLVERLLGDVVGPLAGKLHTGRSRNDQVATDLRLWAMRALGRLDRALAGLGRALVAQAEQGIDILMPAYTHTQRAQPVLLAHHLLAYFEMLERDKGRLADGSRRANVSPLGAGALAGTTFPIDREFVASVLGFAAVSRNSMDAVADRDFVVEFLAAASLLMVHLSRLSEEIVLWSSAEFGFLTIDDAYATGSSIMPQKKNAPVAELTRGKAGRVFGHLLGLLTTLKGLPLAYNQDLQEDKEGLFDTVDTLQITLRVFAEMVRTLTVNLDATARAARGGYMTATDLADYLAKRGLPFRQAHEVVGRIVRQCVESGRELTDLTLQDLQSYSLLFDEGALRVVTPEASVAARDVYGGTAPKQVHARLLEARQMLEH